MEYLHPPPASRKGTVAKSGFFSSKKDVQLLSLENQVLTCAKPVTKEIKWSVNLKECVINGGDKKNELIISQGKRRHKLLARSASEYKSWYCDLLYASKWKFDTFYSMEEKIGEGGFGKVFKCRSLTSLKMYACKVIKWCGIPEAEKVRIKSEMHMLNHLRGDRFVRLYDVFEDSQNKYLVMELANGSDLFTVLEREKRLDEKTVWQIMYQIFQALIQMHRQGFMHRDLKPENIMFERNGDSCDIKIIDFGLAERIGNGSESGTMLKGTGTIGYMAPETIVGASHDEAVDIWACGCIQFVLLSGSMPFNRKGRNVSTVSLRSVSAEYTFSESDWQSVSEEAKSLVRLLLQVQPQKRPDARTALEHKWFKPLPYQFYRRPSARARLRGLVYAITFLFSWKVEKSVRRRSIASLRGFSSKSVTDIFARNSSDAE
eukprot:Plantae.Rhodophyta-Purpureofilum_apyrenoidigerum.ctg19618.p1 GENE.Plantae.Rhodophyta-Purpureofilum_apyrenoidigerum.ctg19618~~Plantae.Rhodophyta-Purpureofilum_apyrenoidigerum.ctg19618.p1  ORF type:complete len:432 (+),score=70.62 Plantae.Rhodophyta-Purpureofilum_apyrenoidigerum.ctg19618:375-1670(+)